MSELGEWVFCDRCDETGCIPDCVDDLCQGEICIHGNMRVCPDCNGEGGFWVEYSEEQTR